MSRKEFSELLLQLYFIHFSLGLETVGEILAVLIPRSITISSPSISHPTQTNPFFTPIPLSSTVLFTDGIPTKYPSCPPFIIHSLHHLPSNLPPPNPHYLHMHECLCLAILHSSHTPPHLYPFITLHTRIPMHITMPVFYLTTISPPFDTHFL